MKPFANRETEAVFLDFLCDCKDPLRLAEQWQEMGNGSAAELLAEQLRKDYFDHYLDSGDNLRDVLILHGLKRVQWQQVAERFLERLSIDEEKPAESEADGECST